jgi:hypothetical protein
MAVRDNASATELGRFLSLVDTVDASVSKLDASKPIVRSYRELFAEQLPFDHVSEIELNSLVIAEGGAAAKAFGQKIATFPLGLIRPMGAEIAFTIKTAATTATAGEIGLGTVIGSGANATLGAVGATSENIMEGTTLANITSTTTSYFRYNDPIIAGTHAATAGSGAIINGSATAAPIYLNICSTWGAAENLTLSDVRIRIHWKYIGKGA